MQTYDLRSSENIRIANISRRTRVFVPVLISLAMMAVSVNFYQADAVFLQASVLPFYILFFVLMYVACLGVEYVSLWCERGKSFHCARVAVHCLALMLVTFETGTFYSSKIDVYSQFPSYSLSKALSYVVKAPSGIDNSRV
jgi:hypothetical protein